MASVYDLKPRFQALLRPMCRWLADRKVRANHVTLAALAISLIHGGLTAIFPASSLLLLALPLVLLLRMALNAIDGMLAREHGQASRLGAFLNELGDVFSDAALYLPFALLTGVPAIPVVLIVVLGVVGEMTGVLAQAAGGTRRYDGPMGKSDRALAFGLLAVLLAVGAAGGWVAFYLWAGVALSLLTIINRARKALAEAQQT